MYLGRQTDVFVRLVSPLYETGDSVPAIGVLPTDVLCKIWKQGDMFWSPMVINSSNWIDLGAGDYVFKLPASQLNVAGPLAIRIEGLEIQDWVKEFDVVPFPLHSTTDHEKCVVFGNVRDISDKVDTPLTMFFTIVSQPVFIGASLLSSKRISVVPDANGDFSVSLLSGILVAFDSSILGIRSQFTIPHQSSANIIDLLPQFP